MTKSLDLEDMNKALKAFQQAEKSELMQINPDLHYNRAMVNTFGMANSIIDLQVPRTIPSIIRRI